MSMVVCFEPTKGKVFFLVVEFTDTVREVKEKIQELKNIPVSKQTLIFKNQFLYDHIDFTYYHDIIDYSHVQLVITLTTDDHPQLIPFSTLPKITLLMRMPLSNTWVAIEIDISQTVRKLKEIIKELERIKVSRIRLHYPENKEMDDCKSLQECKLFSFSEILITLRSSNLTPSSVMPPPPPPPEKLVVWLLTYPHAKKFLFVVKTNENVAVLRKELESIKEEFPEHIYLPENGYMFVYKEQVLKEDQSFLSQSVKYDAIIKVVAHKFINTQSRLAPPRAPRPPGQAPPRRVLGKREAGLEREKMIKLSLQSFPPMPSVPLAPVPGMLSVRVLTYPDAEKITVVVNAVDNVVMLRKLLDQMKKDKPEDIYLPEDGYMFVYEQRVLKEDQSFLWQSVKHDAIILVVAHEVN